MKDQIIITMGREHGSGGHYIADMIARALGIKLYDKDSIESALELLSLFALEPLSLLLPLEQPARLTTMAAAIIDAKIFFIILPPEIHLQPCAVLHSFYKSD